MHAMTLTFMVLNENYDQRAAEVISPELTVHRGGSQIWKMFWIKANLGRNNPDFIWLQTHTSERKLDWTDFKWGWLISETGWGFDFSFHCICHSFYVMAWQPGPDFGILWINGSMKWQPVSLRRLETAIVATAWKIKEQSTQTETKAGESLTYGGGGSRDTGVMKRTEKDGVKDYGLGARQHKQKMRGSESENFLVGGRTKVLHIK